MRTTSPPGVRVASAGFAIAAVALVAAGQSMGATTTIGQTAPNPYTTQYVGGYYNYDYDTPAAVCNTSRDLLQPAVGGGAKYVVPADGLKILSWRTNAATGAGQMVTFKVFRKVAEPSTYEVVAHDGPRTLAPGTANGGTINTFSGLAIPVEQGDVIGLYTDNAGSVNSACMFSAGGDLLFSNTNLSDGTSASFASASGNRLNLSAVVELESTAGAIRHTLTVERAGSASGAVQSVPAGIEACSTSCSHPFDQGTVVTLSATPDSYSSFAGWSGGGCSGQGTCQVTVGSDTTVTATFEKVSYGSGYDYGSPSGAVGPASGGTVPAAARKCRKRAAGKGRGKAGKTACAKKTKRVAKRIRNATLSRDILVTTRGRTLYTLSSEHGTAFFCTSTCLSAWPALKVPSGLRPTGPVKLGAVKRPEGGVQVTHRGRPLYTFSGDSLPGDANGHGMKDASGTWNVVSLPPPRRRRG